jgi:hypothetical protein
MRTLSPLVICHGVCHVMRQHCFFACWLLELKLHLCGQESVSVTPPWNAHLCYVRARGRPYIDGSVTDFIYCDNSELLKCNGQAFVLDYTQASSPCSLMLLSVPPVVMMRSPLHICCVPLQRNRKGAFGYKLLVRLSLECITGSSRCLLGEFQECKFVQGM